MNKLLTLIEALLEADIRPFTVSVAESLEDCVVFEDAEDSKKYAELTADGAVYVHDNRPAQVRALEALHEPYSTWRWKHLEDDDPRVVAHRKAIAAAAELFALAEGAMNEPETFRERFERLPEERGDAL